MAGNNGIGDNLSPITNNTRDNLSSESLTQVMKQMEQYQLAYITCRGSIKYVKNHYMVVNSNSAASQLNMKKLSLSLNFSHLSPVSLKLVIKFYFRTYLGIFIKILKGPN
jgi:hypothetical protein